MMTIKRRNAYFERGKTINDIKDKLKRCAVPLFVAGYYFLFKSQIKQLDEKSYFFYPYV